MSLTFVLSKQLPTHHHSTVSIPTVTTHSSPVSIGAHLYTSFIIGVASNQTDIPMPAQSYWKDNHFCSWYTKIPKIITTVALVTAYPCIVEDLLGDQLNTPRRVFLLYLPIFIFTNVGCSNIQIPSHLTPASFPGKHLWTPTIAVYCRRQFRRFVSYPSQLRLSRWYGPELSPK